MTIKEQLEALIDAGAYRACWSGSAAPGFGEFMAFATSAFENALPKDATNLKIAINSRGDGRINTLGSFELGGNEFEVFGQIVWVDKHRFFRGKPGFRRRQAPVVAPPDESATYSLVADTVSDLNGFGTVLEVSPRSLVRAFGQPGVADEFKVSGMYVFEGDRGAAFRINDYEETTLYWGEERRGEFPTPGSFWDSDEPRQLRVAGNRDPARFVEWVRLRIGTGD